MASRKPIAILGGGISGLSAAFYLTKLGQSVVTPLNFQKIVLIESSDRLGGWLNSRKFDDGVIHELGPRSIRLAGKVGLNTINMVEELALSDEVTGVSKYDPAANKRFIYVNGKLCKLPAGGLFDLVRRLPPFSRSFLKMAFSEMRTPITLNPEEDVSVYHLVQNRFGDEAAKYLADPFCRGITAGDSHKLSFPALFPAMYRGYLTGGSLIKGMLGKQQVDEHEFHKLEAGALAEATITNRWTTWNLKDGLQSLPDAMERAIVKSGHVSIHKNTSVQKIEFNSSDGSAKIFVNKDNAKHSIEVDHVFSTLPSNVLSEIIPHHELLTNELKKIPFVDVAVVVLEYEGKSTVGQELGFGFLVPSSENSEILGITFDSNCFPVHDAHQNVTRITCMMGGAWFNEYFGSGDEDKILSTAIKESSRILGFKTDPRRYTIGILRSCIPQYNLGHKAHVAKANEYIKSKKMNLHLTGASYSGVSVNDVIYNTRLAVSDFLLKHRHHAL